MTTNIDLTDTQRAVLEHAADHPNGTVAWFPPSCKGGAIGKVITCLYNKGLITDILNAEDNLRSITSEGFEALGRVPPAPDNPGPAVEVAVTAAEATWAQDEADSTHDLVQAAKPRTRANSKQAQVIAMLTRPEGATIQQIAAATNWQAHTIRGTFAGSFKKKLGLTLTSEKPEGGERTYRIA